MKNYRKIMPLVMIGLMVLSCVAIINGSVTDYKDYKSYIAAAEKAASKKISGEVDENYMKALELKDDVDIYYSWCQYYQSLDDFGMATTIGENAVTSFPKEAKAYQMLLECYVAKESYFDFFETYAKATKLKSTNDAIKKMYQDNRYKYYLGYETYSEANSFSGGIAKVAERNMFNESEVTYGYASGRGPIPCQFKEATAFSGGDENLASVIDKNGEVFIINNTGTRKYVIEPKNIKVARLGIFSNGVIPVFDGSQYYICDIESKVIAGPYDYVSTFNCGVAAVKKGDAWSLIDTAGQTVAKGNFESFVIDENEFVCRRDLLFARINDFYYLIDKSGNKVTDKRYDDAKVIKDSYAAVCVNGKWGFIDGKGNEVIPCKYEDAKSFCNGAAAVKQGGKWGLIGYDESSKKDFVIVPFEFDDATSFSQTARVSMVKLGDEWTMLRFYEDGETEDY